MKINRVVPPAALPGGLVRVELSGLKEPSSVGVEVGGESAEILGASSTALTIRVPRATGNGIVVRSERSAQADLKVGRLVASELHPVASPVVDSLGNVYVTFSGSRGEKVPVSIFVFYPDGSRHPFLADITNPTGMVIGSDDCLYITSRHSSTVYRSTFDKQVEKYADGLGLATGLVFDSQGNLLVGDRSGTVYKVSPRRDLSVLCELEPSVSAFHLALDQNDMLYVTGPTLATQDCIYKISPQGEVEVFFKGLGRPQGIGFDRQGRLQVTASYRGKKGLYRFIDGTPELTLSGPMLVGFAHDHQRGQTYLVDSENLYQIESE